MKNKNHNNIKSYLFSAAVGVIIGQIIIGLIPISRFLGESFLKGLERVQETEIEINVK